MRRKKLLKKKYWAVIGDGLPSLANTRDVCKTYLLLLNGRRIARVQVTELPGRGGR